MSFHPTSSDGSTPASKHVGRQHGQVEDAGRIAGHSWPKEEVTQSSLSLSKAVERPQPQPIAGPSTGSRQSDVHAILNPSTSPPENLATSPYGWSATIPRDTRPRPGAAQDHELGSASLSPIDSRPLAQTYVLQHLRQSIGDESTNAGSGESSSPSSPARSNPSTNNERAYLAQPPTTAYSPQAHRDYSYAEQSSSARDWSHTYPHPSVARTASTGKAARSSRSSSGPKPGEQLHYLTIDTEQGPLPVSVNVQTASRAADEKRKRNAQASARFRKRTKEGRQANAAEIDTLKQKIKDLEEDVDHYRGERDHFRDVAFQGVDHGRPHQRPPSPRLMRSASASGESNPPSAMEDTAVQRAHSTHDIDRFHSARRAREEQDLEPNSGTWYHRHQAQVYSPNVAYSPQGYGQLPLPPHQPQFVHEQGGFPPLHQPFNQANHGHDQQRQLPPIRPLAHEQSPSFPASARPWAPTTRGEPP